MRTVTSIHTTQSPMHPTPLKRLSIKSPLLHHYPKPPPHRSQRRTPLLRNRAHHPSKITFRHLLHTPFRSPGRLPHRPHLACDVSRPTFPSTPRRPLVAANFTSCELRSQPFARGISSTCIVPVAWTPPSALHMGKPLAALLRGRHQIFRRPDRARRRSRGGRLPDVQSTSGGSDSLRGRGEGVICSLPLLIPYLKRMHAMQAR